MMHHRVIVSNVPGLEDHLERAKLQATEYYDQLSISKIPKDGMGEPPSGTNYLGGSRIEVITYPNPSKENASLHDILSFIGTTIATLSQPPVRSSLT